MTSDKTRGIALTALMVLSVVAGGIAFTGTAAAAGSTEVTVQPASDTIDNGSTTTYDIVVETADNGVGAYEFYFNSSDASVAQVTDVTLGGDPADSTTSVEYSESGDSVHVTAALANTSNTGSVTMAEVTVEGTGAGSADLSTNVESLGDEDGNAYDVTATNNGAITVESAGDGDNGEEPPADGEPDADRVFDSVDALEGSLVFQGQTIAVDVSGQVANGEEVYLRQGDAESSTARATKTVEDGYVTFDTSNRETADYFLRGGSVDASNSAFEIVEQNIEASIDPASVTNGGTDSTTTLTVTSDLRTSYDATVTIEEFSESDYNEVFSDVRQDSDGNYYGYLAGVEGDTTLDFEGIDAGNYTLDVGVTDTTAEDSVDLTVDEAAETTTDFVSTTQTPRGDIGAINVSLTNADEAVVVIGSEDRGYQANVTVNDGNDDGYVEFEINTYTMGENDASAFYVPGDSEDSVTDVTFPTEDLSEPIASGSYRTTVRAGDDPTATANDVSRFSIGAANGITGQNIWTAPASADLSDFVSDATLTQDSSIAEGDYVVHEIEASGVFGVLQNASSANATQALLNAVDNGELDLDVVQTEGSTQLNRDPKTLDYAAALENDNAVVVSDRANSTLYIAADLAAVDASPRDIQFGNDVFNASVTLTESTNLVDDNSTASAEYSADELEHELAQDEYTVESAANQSITATSTAADGTEYNILVESVESPGEGYIIPSNPATVEDGELTAEVDFSDAAVNSTFEVSLQDPNGDTVDTATGEVVEQTAPETTEPTDTTEGTTQTTEGTQTTAGPTETTAGPTETTAAPTDTTEGGTDGGIPGFGMGIALVAVLGAALLALRRDN